MNLNFSVEDINIEITDAGGEEVEETVEDQIADQEAQEEVEEASEEVETAAKFGMQLVAIHENLSFIKQHVQMFGVTKQMLHLVNANGQLGSAIGLALPYYESDDEAADIVMDDVPETEVMVEAIGETLTKWKENVKKFFKMIWEKLKDLGRAFMTRVMGLKKTITNLQAKFKETIDEEAYKALSDVSIITAKEWEDKYTALTNACTELSKADASDSTSLKNKYNSTAAYVGKGVEADEKGITIKPATASVTPKKQNQATVWSSSDINTVLKIVNMFVQNGMNKSDITTAIKKAETDAIKAIDGSNNDTNKDANANKKAIIIKNTSGIVSLYNSFMNERINMVRQFIAIAKRVPMKGKEKSK